jgi:hypothetical protein
METRSAKKARAEARDDETRALQNVETQLANERTKPIYTRLDISVIEYDKYIHLKFKNEVETYPKVADLVTRFLDEKHVRDKLTNEKGTSAYHQQSGDKYIKSIKGEFAAMAEGNPVIQKLVDDFLEERDIKSVKYRLDYYRSLYRLNESTYSFNKFLAGFDEEKGRSKVVAKMLADFIVEREDTYYPQKFQDEFKEFFLGTMTDERKNRVKTDEDLVAFLAKYSSASDRLPIVHSMLRTFELMYAISRHQTQRALDLIRTGEILNTIGIWDHRNFDRRQLSHTSPLVYAVCFNEIKVMQAIVGKPSFKFDAYFTGSGGDHNPADEVVAECLQTKLPDKPIPVETLKAMMGLRDSNKKLVFGNLSLDLFSHWAVQEDNAKSEYEFFVEHIQYPGKNHYNTFIREMLMARSVNKKFFDAYTNTEINYCVPVDIKCFHKDESTCFCNHSVLVALLVQKGQNRNRWTKITQLLNYERENGKTGAITKFKVDLTKKLGPDRLDLLRLTYRKHDIDILSLILDVCEKDKIPEPIANNRESFMYYVSHPLTRKYTTSALVELLQVLTRMGYNLNYVRELGQHCKPNNKHAEWCWCGSSLMTLTIEAGKTDYAIGEWVRSTLVDKLDMVYVKGQKIGRNEYPLLHYVLDSATRDKTEIREFLQKFVRWIYFNDRDVMTQRAGTRTPIEIVLNQASGKEDPSPVRIQPSLSPRGDGKATRRVPMGQSLEEMLNPNPDPFVMIEPLLPKRDQYGPATINLYSSSQSEQNFTDFRIELLADHGATVDEQTWRLAAEKYKLTNPDRGDIDTGRPFISLGTFKTITVLYNRDNPGSRKALPVM